MGWSLVTVPSQPTRVLVAILFCSVLSSSSIIQAELLASFPADRLAATKHGPEAGRLGTITRTVFPPPGGRLSKHMEMDDAQVFATPTKFSVILRHVVH